MAYRAHGLTALRRPAPFYPLQRVYHPALTFRSRDLRPTAENVSSEGWQQWLERLTTIINENGLTTADTQHIELIEKHMRGFFFGEGDYGQLPAGFHPPGSGGKK